MSDPILKERKSIRCGFGEGFFLENSYKDVFGSQTGVGFFALEPVSSLCFLSPELLVQN